MTDLWFLTTNAVKLSNFRSLSRGTGLSIHSFHERTFLASYSEPRLGDRQEILRLSYESALDQWRRAELDEEAFFFIEDTSLIIHALSDQVEVPGVDVKYWMREMDFATLDALLKARGNDRSVTVRSDIVLHLPPSVRAWSGSGTGFMQFTGETNGRVVDSERTIDGNPLRPWQDSKSFNKWFVPEGQDVPFSALDPDSADYADFRRRAFEKLCLFLSEIGINSTVETRPAHQLVIPGIEPAPPVVVICGLSGSGKTTLAEYLVRRAGYMHFEASDFMRYEYHERLGRTPSVRVSEFAAQVLRSEPWVIPEKVLSSIDNFANVPIVITGFRSEREVSHLLENYSGGGAVEVLVVEARQRLRYERIRARGRADAPTSLLSLRQKDQEQLDMGVANIRRVWPNVLKNNGTIAELIKDFKRMLSVHISRKRVRNPRVVSNELERSVIRAMGSNKNDSDLTTTEIARLVNKLSLRGFITQKDNVSRYFNQRYSPYFSFRVADGKLRYSLSQTGRSYYLALKASLQTDLKRSLPEKKQKNQLELF